MGKVPSTSRAAYEQAKNGLISSHQEKIKEALGVLGVANYEVIAAKCGLERHAVGRRLSEMEALQIVYKPGTKSKTKTGRDSYNYCLTEAHAIKVEHPCKPLIKTTASAKSLLQQIKMF
jgi:hypothetical protein